MLLSHRYTHNLLGEDNNATAISLNALYQVKPRRMS